MTLGGASDPHQPPPPHPHRPCLEFHIGRHIRTYTTATRCPRTGGGTHAHTPPRPCARGDPSQNLPGRNRTAPAGANASARPRAVTRPRLHVKPALPQPLAFLTRMVLLHPASAQPLPRTARHTFTSSGQRGAHKRSATTLCTRPSFEEAASPQRPSCACKTVNNGRLLYVCARAPSAAVGVDGRRSFSNRLVRGPAAAQRPALPGVGLPRQAAHMCGHPGAARQAANCHRLPTARQCRVNIAHWER